MNKIKIAVVGLHFGAEFVPIYQNHPDVSEVIIADINPAALNKIKEKYNIDRVYDCLDDVLNEPDIDCVHLVTPVNHHAPQSVAVMQSGKHCACTIPMGLSLSEIEDVIRAQRNPAKII